MFATIYLPNFYLQAAMRHQPRLRAQPVALINTEQAKVSVVQINEPAEKAGVSKGMAPSQALARCLRVVIKTRERAQEKLIDEILLQHAFTLSPYVEDTAPGVCTIQFTDPWHRHLADGSGQTGISWAGSPCPKVARVIQRLAKCEITAQAGIARLPDASFLAAHLARPVLQIDDAQEFFAPLPIETLATDVADFCSMKTR
jgi:protein ImuB